MGHLLNSTPTQSIKQRIAMPQIFPIAGGKGGVGKSFISANLGTLMAKYGYRVALIDLDLGASNLHTFLGVKKPKYIKS